MRIRLREQMETYSAQFKAAPDTFGKDRISLSGKVGGMKDDVCICLQLAAYYTQLETQRAADMFSKLEWAHGHPYIEVYTMIVKLELPLKQG